MLLLVKNPMVKKDGARQRCRDATGRSLVAKVRGEVFAHFHTVVVIRHSSLQNLLLGLPDELFDVNENYERALDFGLHLSRQHRVEAGKNTSTVIPVSRKKRQKGNPVVSGETASRPKRRLMRTYHWISLFKSYIETAN
jgi:hypothetical protein